MPKAIWTAALRGTATCATALRCNPANTLATEQHQNHDTASLRQPVARTTQKYTVLTTPEADTTVRTNELAAKAQGNGKHITPTLAPSTGNRTAQRTKPSLTEVVSMLNKDWFAMQDVIGNDVLICRPGFTTFALQTHIFCWSFVSDCATEEKPTEDCRYHNQ